MGNGADASVPDVQPLAYRRVTYGLVYERGIEADREIWRAFIRAAIRRGHQIVVLSMSENCPDTRNRIRKALDDTFDSVVILYVGRRPIRQYVSAAGHVIDNWLMPIPELVTAASESHAHALLSKHPARESFE